MSAKGHVLGDIEPITVGLAKELFSAPCSQAVESSVPEVKIVDRSLLISHVDVEGKEVDRGQGLPAEDLKKRG